MALVLHQFKNTNQNHFEKCCEPKFKLKYQHHNFQCATKISTVETIPKMIQFEFQQNDQKKIKRKSYESSIHQENSLEKRSTSPYATEPTLPRVIKYF
ncbi:hypothetical protein M0813_30198 [Anaeramoeba flamelloides]|uniref:Uncharacterized protein n=1 Tax=Anaeramoeba flamelloides TaxID=1746091 RepID=A0ABQ8XKB9_9EUKA|nr:hypothetical protein M0813_30198 [Anaeramoeba flamelloides]